MKNYIIILAISLVACKQKNKVDDNPILGDETVTFIIKELPENHDYESDIYLSGNFEGWSGGREQFKLKKEGKNYRITLPKYRDNVSFKFTKGKWGLEETQINGNPIENRIYSFEKLKDTVYITISNWAEDTENNKTSTASKNVHVFAEEFNVPQLNSKHKIQVYLPPDYESSTNEYPVLYMMDGQNVFDEVTSYSGEWEVDETLNRMFMESGFSLIVVAIDHAGENRFNEYAPWDHHKFGTGEGEAFTEFLVETLKPTIDNNYRTKSDRLNTGLLGSSMGGLISHYAVLKESKIFGRGGVFSPAFWLAEPVYDFTKVQTISSNTKLYYLAGGQESETMVVNVERMTNILNDKGVSQLQLKLKIVPEGTHSESFWKEEFEEAIAWLYDIKN